MPLSNCVALGESFYLFLFFFFGDSFFIWKMKSLDSLDSM